MTAATLRLRVLALAVTLVATAAHAGVPPRRADFAGRAAAPEVKQVADWVVDAGDARGKPYIVIDKRNARLYVFDAAGRLQGDAPVLLGLARGDHTVLGIGDKPLSQVMPHERTTPAGRFPARQGRNATGEDVIWIDYDAAVSMHRLRPMDPRERRLQRIATPTAADNRISNGCVNVPAAFYDRVILGTVGRGDPLVYVLPEVRTVQQVMGSYDVDRRASGD